MLIAKINKENDRLLDAGGGQRFLRMVGITTEELMSNQDMLQTFESRDILN